MSSTRVHNPIRTYTNNLKEDKPGSRTWPYGWYKYESAKNHLPGGLFHFVREPDCYVPTLHGLSIEYILGLKEVGVCECESVISSRPFSNTPHIYPVELINTGCETLKQGDRFTVQLPNQHDITRQHDIRADLRYSSCINKGIWGGLLATRKVNCETGGDPVEEVIQAIKQDEDFNVFQLTSPYVPQCILSMLTLLANGGEYHQVSDDTRNNAAHAINFDFDADITFSVLDDAAAQRYLRTILVHASNILESVQGFAGGQVLKAQEGSNCSLIHTGDRFLAQLNMSRWLS